MVLTTQIESAQIDSLISVGKGKLNELNNNWEEENFLQPRAFFERLFSSVEDKEELWVDYYLALADYRLGIFYSNVNENKKNAKKYFLKGLEINPNYYWIREELLPGLD